MTASDFGQVTGLSKNIFAVSAVRVASAGDAVYAARQVVAVLALLLLLRSERVLETRLGIVVVLSWHLQLRELVLFFLFGCVTVVSGDFFGRLAIGAGRILRALDRRGLLSLLLESLGFGFFREALGFFLLLPCLLEGGLGLFLLLAAALRLFGGLLSLALLFGLNLAKTLSFSLSCGSCLGVVLLLGEACGLFGSDSLTLCLLFFRLEPSGFLLRFDTKAFLLGLVSG